MVRVGGGWDTLEHFLSRHEPCQVRLVTQGRRASVLPVPVSQDDTRPRNSISPASSKASSLGGTVSPIDSKASSNSGKLSPIGKTSKPNSGKTSPLYDTARRTSTPYKPNAVRSLKSALTLPLNPSLDEVDGRPQKPTRNRKQSAPSSFSTPNTPTTRQPKTNENRKSFNGTTLTNGTKKSRSMNLAGAQKTEEKKQFCGTERLNSQAKKKSTSLAGTPTKEYSLSARNIRSQSLASTPDTEQKKTFCGTDKLNQAKKTRSMSLANPVPFKPMNKSLSVTVPGAMTQAAIEESIRLSLAASIADHSSSKKPFLHIKAKYRSPPPREVPPR